MLVPLDFSGQSRQALEHAVPLARKFGAKILLVHVLPPPYHAAAEIGLILPGIEGLRKGALMRLEATASKLVPARLQAGCSVLTGHPARQILELAEEREVDMIVLTTKGRTGVSRLLLGGTASHVMRRAGCPVLSVRRP